MGVLRTAGQIFCGNLSSGGTGLGSLVPAYAKLLTATQTSLPDRGLNHGSAALKAARLICFPSLLLTQSLPRKRFFSAALFAGLHVKAMLLDFLNDVFLLHFALEAPQCVFQRLTFLDNDFGHYEFTPNPVRIGFLAAPCELAAGHRPQIIIACGPQSGHADTAHKTAMVFTGAPVK